ncbi:hypothetical protein Tco_1385370 [Tanacetum coccineum]
MSALKFVDSHNMVAFLAKPTESEGFEKIVDFLNTNPIKYALTAYSLQSILHVSSSFWVFLTSKVKTINGDVQLHALMDKKKVIITKSIIRIDLQLEDAEVFLDKQVGDMSTHDKKFVTPSHTKKVFGNMKRVGKGFSGIVTPLFPTMMVQAQKEIGGGSAMPTDPHTHPSGPIEPIADEATTEENVPTQSNDPPLSRVNTLGSGEDRLTLKELMDLCTKLSDRVLDLEITKTTQAKEIASLKKRVKKLEKKKNSKTPGMKRLFKISRYAQVVSSEDEGLGDQEDASKQGRKITDIDQDAEVTLVDETQGRYDDAQMFDTDVFNGEEVFVAEQSEKVVEEIVSGCATITTKVDLKFGSKHWLN